MHLLSPKPISIDRRVQTAIMEYPFEYNEEGMEIPQNGRISKLFIGELPPIGDAGMSIKLHIPSQEEIRNFLKLQKLVNSCINDAEDIKRKLHGLVEFILRRQPELVKASHTYDFMKLKDTLIDYIKKDDKTRHLADKAFRKSLNQFVIDRNIYTHGHLMLRYTDNAPLIQYQNNITKITTYALLNVDTLQSYYNASKSIIDMISEFRKIMYTPT